MATDWFTADWHFNHTRIIELCERPFKTVSHMNETIIRNHNELVAPGDNVYVLGDVALGNIDEMPRLVQRMNGRKFLIPGNHDRCWQGNRRVRGIDTQRYIDAGFEILAGTALYTGGSRPYQWLVCHFPPQGDSHGEDRFPWWRPKPGPNEWVVHGHTHDNIQVVGHNIHVGVDAWDFKPVNVDEIGQIIELVEADFSISIDDVF